MICRVRYRADARRAVSFVFLFSSFFWVLELWIYVFPEWHHNGGTSGLGGKLLNLIIETKRIAESQMGVPEK